jgi:hypothetical protein
MDCCSLSVTGPQTSTSRAILIKCYSKHYHHMNVSWIKITRNFKVDFSSAAIFYWPFSSVIDRNRNRPFNLIQNKVGYGSCFVTGVKLQSMYTSNRQLYYHCLILIGLVSTVILKCDRDTCCCRYRIHLHSYILFKNEWMNECSWIM